MIEVKNIQKAFVSGTQQVQVAKGLSFQIKRGEFVSIVGPSGSGKSTLLHMLGGLDVPDAGSIVVEGQEITTFGSKALAKYRAHTTGFVFQAFHLEPLYTVYDNVRVALMIARVEDGLHKKKIQEALEQVGMLQKIHTHFSISNPR